MRPPASVTRISSCNMSCLHMGCLAIGAGFVALRQPHLELILLGRAGVFGRLAADFGGALPYTVARLRIAVALGQLLGLPVGEKIGHAGFLRYLRRPKRSSAMTTARSTSRTSRCMATLPRIAVT